MDYTCWQGVYIPVSYYPSHHCCIWNEVTILLFQPPPSSLLCRYDPGRNCYVPHIPVFRKQEDVSGTVYPMLGELGGGSIEVNFELPNIQNCVLKVYPEVIHYIKARNRCGVAYNSEEDTEPCWSN